MSAEGRRRLRRGAASIWLVGAALAAATPSVAGFATIASAAAKPNWDRVSNIREAAQRLADLQRSRGALGTFKFISDCYKTQTLASSYTRFLESCLIQDIIHSRATAAVYGSLTPEQRRETGVPEPEVLTRTMAQRVAATLSQYKLSAVDMQALIRLVDQHGMSEYARARFPQEADAPGDRKPSGN